MTRNHNWGKVDAIKKSGEKIYENFTYNAERMIKATSMSGFLMR